MFVIIATVTAILMAWVAFSTITKSGKPKAAPESSFPNEWKSLLEENVRFYQRLNEADKKSFEIKIQQFLANVTITGVELEIDDLDSLLIASSAVIPIFNFPDWHYYNLSEVLVYSDSFDHDFRTHSSQPILGMVGEGFMQGKMALSKKSLHLGFGNKTDKHNTAVHEFVHLIDKSDGNTDGVPELLLEHQYVMPWLKLMHQNIQEIRAGHSDIRSYGATNEQEFLAVVGEYFFERPELLHQKHPELFEYLTLMFGKKST